MSGSRKSEADPMTAEEQEMRDLMREVFFSGGTDLDCMIERFFDDEGAQ